MFRRAYEDFVGCLPVNQRLRARNLDRSEVFSAVLAYHTALANKQSRLFTRQCKVIVCQAHNLIGSADE